MTSGLTNIGEFAFAYDGLLNSVVIPSGVTSLAGFAYCTALTNAAIPESVVNIEDDAFLGCAKLANAAIPGAVTNIGNYAFESCGNLTSITFAGSVGDLCFRILHQPDKCHVIQRRWQYWRLCVFWVWRPGQNCNPQQRQLYWRWRFCEYQFDQSHHLKWRLGHWKWCLLRMRPS